MNNVLLINEAACRCVCVCVCVNPHLKEDLPMQRFHFVCGACEFLSACRSDIKAACVPLCPDACVTSSSLVRRSPSTEQLQSSPLHSLTGRNRFQRWQMTVQTARERLFSCDMSARVWERRFRFPKVPNPGLLVPEEQRFYRSFPLLPSFYLLWGRWVTLSSDVHCISRTKSSCQCYFFWVISAEKKAQ